MSEELYILENMVTINQRKRVGWVDALRGFGIVLMIVGHANYLPTDLKHMIYRFHMPLFFVLAGYLFRPEKYENLNELIRDKFRRYVIPYFVLSGINLVLNGYFEYQVMGLRDFAVSTGKHIFWILFACNSASKTPNSSPLWFLPCIFLATVYLYVFMTCSKKKVKYALAICGLAGAVYIHYKFNRYMPWHFDVAVFGAAFMYLGYKLKNGILSEILWQMNMALLCVGLGVAYINGWWNIAGTYDADLVMAFIGAVSVSVALLSVFSKHYRHVPGLEFMGRNTMIFMAFNYAVLDGVNIVWKRYFPQILINWYVQSLLVILLCCLIAWVWTMVKRRYPRIAIF